MELLNVYFCNCCSGCIEEIEIPMNITANELILSLDRAFNLGIEDKGEKNMYLAMENPIAFLSGDKYLSDFGIRTGSKIIYKRG